MCIFFVIMESMFVTCILLRGGVALRPMNLPIKGFVKGYVDKNIFLVNVKYFSNT